MPKNIDRNTYDVTSDLEPIRVTSILQSANGGSTRRQSQLASSLLEKDPAISQSWGVRVLGTTEPGGSIAWSTGQPWHPKASV